MHLPDTQKIPFLARSTAAKLLGMFLLVLGVKFWMLQTSSAPLPVFDQWGAEGERLLQPLLHGQYRLGNLFEPWCQHRIVWTRLLVLGLFEINGQWDTQVEAMANELIHASTALFLGIILLRRMERRWEDAILLGLLLLYGLPISLANTLSGGFQSQYYVLLLCAAVTCWGLGTRRPGSAGWWVGAASGIAAWFSVATGALPTLAVAAWMALRLMSGEGSARENRLTLGVSLALGAGGLSLMHGVTDINDLKPHSAGEFLSRFLGYLGWPNPTAWVAPVAFAPFALLVWRALRRRRASGPAEAFLLPFGTFVVLNSAALAYARNHYGGLQVSRYVDLLSPGALVNFACILLFLQEARQGGTDPRVRSVGGLCTAIWVAGAGFGLLQVTTRNVANALPFIHACSDREVEDVAAFVAHPDAKELERRCRVDNLCDNPPVASRLLQDPKILAILPAAVRPPVALTAATASPLVHRVNLDPSSERRAGWVLEPSPDHQPVHFRSQVIDGPHLPYLRFPDVGNLGDEGFIALVEERTGATTWLQPGSAGEGWQPILVKTPDGPFHVEAVLAADAERRLAFTEPREVGRLSAWTGPLLNGATLLMGAGLVSWLGAVFWRRLGLNALAEIRLHLPVVSRRNPAGVAVEG